MLALAIVLSLACATSTAPAGQPPADVTTQPGVTAQSPVPSNGATPSSTTSPGSPPSTGSPSSPLTTAGPTARPGPAGDSGNVTGTLVLSKPGKFGDIQITATQISKDITVEIIARDLEVPWALDFAPDGRIFITERPGRIRVVQGGELKREPFAVLKQVVSISESGLMGLALHPQFVDNGYLYVCYTYQNREGFLRNRVARLTDANGVGTDHQVILDDIPGARNHNGCRLGFGPDGKLYVTTGDAEEGSNAQDLGSLAGKILRLEDDGSVPEDNPFIASYVYTYGHRNPQGLDWHPITGDLFITEHGPDRNDEINILDPGLNYGWPEVTGQARSAEFVPSLKAYTPTLAVAGAAFYDGAALHPSWRGSFIYATLKSMELRRIVLEPPDYRTVDYEDILLKMEYGRLRAVAVSPEGHLYFTTSNRDGRGDRNMGDDMLLRLAPVIANPSLVYRTDKDGNFTLDLEPGYYHVRWEGPGFAPQERWLTIAPDQNFDLGRIVLRP